MLLIVVISIPYLEEIVVTNADESNNKLLSSSTVAAVSAVLFCINSINLSSVVVLVSKYVRLSSLLIVWVETFLYIISFV